MDFSLEPVLEYYHVQFQERAGNQMVRCPNVNAHAHNDRTKSLSVKLGRGVANCHACGLAGDAVALIMGVEGVSRSEAIRRAEAFVHSGGGTLSWDSEERSFLPRAKGTVRREDHPYLPSRARHRAHAGGRNGGE